MSLLITSWIEEARAGDTAVLGRLLENYRSYLQFLAQVEIGRRLQGKVDPADVVQETFLDAHRYFSQFRGDNETTFLAWLREILAGTLANIVRRYLGTKARDIRLERELTVTIDHSSQMIHQMVVDPKSSPSQQAVRQEEIAVVTEALSKLPDDYRQVIILRHLEGLPFAQVAERMGRTVDSVEKLWLRGVTQLRKAVGGESSP